MQKSRVRSAPNSGRQTAFISLGMVGLTGVGLLGFWWNGAIKTPVVTIPNPAMPSPNAFDYYVEAGNAVVNDKQIADAVSTKQSNVFTLAQKETLVKQNVAAIAALHKGFAYPYLNPPARSFTTLFPYYARFRVTARLLALQSQVRSARGDWKGAVDSDLDAMRMAVDIPHGSPLIGDLVGIACNAIGRRPIWSAVEHLNAAETRGAILRLTSIMERKLPYADTIEQEKWGLQAALLEIFDTPKKRNTLVVSGGIRRMKTPELR